MSGVCRVASPHAHWQTQRSGCPTDVEPTPCESEFLHLTEAGSPFQWNGIEGRRFVIIQCHLVDVHSQRRYER